TRGGGEQYVQVLMPGLVDRVRRVEAELVRGLDVLDAVVERVVRQHAVAEPHDGSSMVSEGSPASRTSSAKWSCIRLRWPQRAATVRCVSQAGMACCGVTCMRPGSTS